MMDGGRVRGGAGCCGAGRRLVDCREEVVRTVRAARGQRTQRLTGQRRGSAEDVYECWKSRWQAEEYIYIPRWGRDASARERCGSEIARGGVGRDYKDRTARFRNRRRTSAFPGSAQPLFSRNLCLLSASGPRPRSLPLHARRSYQTVTIELATPSCLVSLIWLGAGSSRVVPPSPRKSPSRPG
ncbi:hypothetical protein BD413DRAFT_11187 [Trametes elegans]|nr:hypothetical protein BD413DRAFT_11187 [Trametes elegans]